LSKILHKWKLDRYVRLPVLRGTVLGGTVGRSTAASTTEALVGAVWMDSVHDFDTVHRVVHNLGIATQLSQDVNHVLGNIESTMGELELV
jgi:ribonuclease-3